MIRGSGVNHNGNSPGISAPNQGAQARLIRDVYRKAGLAINNTDFVEAHGTGTMIGDPIEANAIASAFQTRKRKAPLFIGAIKSGIGHLEGASGIAGIIKSVLMLENGIIPPNVNFEKPNPKIDPKKLKVAFPLQSLPWPSSGLRRVSVNSFGVGGTNAHTILDDAYHYLLGRNLSASHNTRVKPPTKDELQDIIEDVTMQHQRKTESRRPVEQSVPNGRSSSTHKPTANGTLTQPSPAVNDSQATPRIFAISAFDKEGIQRNAASIADYLSRSAHLSSLTLPASVHFLDDVAFTLSDKRTQFGWRAYVVAKSVAELATNIEQSSLAHTVHAKKPPRIAFIFTGQGAQYYRMGRVLMPYNVFRESLECASAFMQTLGQDSWDLIGT